MGDPTVLTPLPWYLRARLKPRQLLLLVALADEGNIHRASELLRMAQPGASKLLKDLEDMLGVELFERHSRGMRPTWYGDSLIRHARMVLATLEEAGEELESLKAGRFGRVGIGAVTSPAMSVLPAAISLVKREQPHLQISIHIETSDLLLERLGRGELDMVIGRVVERFDTELLRFERLSDEPVSVIARNGHPLLSQQNLTLAELEQAAWVIPPVGSVLRNPFDQMFRQAGLDGPRVTVESASLLFITKMLQESDFIAVVATEIANYYAKHGMVSIVPIDLPCEMEPFGLVLRKDRLLSPAATKVLTALRQTASAVYGVDLDSALPGRA
ncbi:MAG: LysR family transcriptional regulator [Xanthomonadaceae bacterium]|nr:LysR family transcriptional regulator [Xanthomonadaceae bacterium]